MEKFQNFIMQSYRSIIGACILLVLSILLTGCSAARLGYSNGEMLSYWWLDNYVEFTSDQTPLVKKELADLFAWHRRTQLQEYVQFLKRAQSRIEQPVTEAELQRDYNDLKKHLLVLVDKALPALAELALSLSEAQIDNIERKFSSNNDEYRKHHLHGSLEKRQQLRSKKVLQQAENWFGRFNEEQKEQIRALSNARPLNNELVLVDRTRRHAATIALLRKIQSEKPTHDVAMSMIRSHVVALINRTYNPEQKSYFDQFRASSIQMTAAIINGATPEQKAHAIKVAQRWIDDFSSLSR